MSDTIDAYVFDWGRKGFAIIDRATGNRVPMTRNYYATREEAEERLPGAVAAVYNMRANQAADRVVAAAEAETKTAAEQRTATLATDAQIDYAWSLIVRRTRSGEQGGWMNFSGGYPTRAQLAAMGRREISALISNMRDSFDY